MTIETKKHCWYTPVLPYVNGLANDLGNFLPLQPVTSNAKGEFAQILQWDEIIPWLDEHPEAQGLPGDVERLRGMKEEDNPVIVIME